MKALILAGGKATRLYPITLYMPKQLIMVAGYPVINYVVSHCKSAGIKDVVLCISNNSLKQHFFNALGDGSSLGVSIVYSIAPESTGTAGRVVQAKGLLEGDSDFLVYYGDILSFFDLHMMIDFHRRSDAVATLAITGNKQVDFGAVECDRSSGRICSFREKPKVSEISTVGANIGIAVFDWALFKYCADRREDLFGDVVPRMLDRGEAMLGYVVEEPFFDIGTFSNIAAATDMIRRRAGSKKVPFDIITEGI